MDVVLIVVAVVVFALIIIVGKAHEGASSGSAECAGDETADATGDSVRALSDLAAGSRTSRPQSREERRESRQAGRRLAELDAELSKCQEELTRVREFGVFKAELGHLTLYTMRLSVAEAMKPASIKVMSGMKSRVSETGSIEVIHRPGKQRTTATRIVTGGLIAGPAGAAAGAMAKKTVRDSTVDSHDDRRIEVTIVNPTGESIVTSIPWSDRQLCDEFLLQLDALTDLTQEQRQGESDKEERRLTRRLKALEEQRSAAG